MRWFALAALVLSVAACKKHKPEDDPVPPPAGAPQVGHTTARFKTDGTAAAGDPDGGVAANTAPDAANAGAYRDSEGHVHGPGGPVYMGDGAKCDATHDHCLREGVWFQASNVVRGKLYRAVPVFTFEDKWYTWANEPADTDGKVYKTKVAGAEPIPPGTTVIYFSFSGGDDDKWADSVYDALTSSRWEIAVVDDRSPPTGPKLRIAGWGDVNRDAVRLITDQKSF